MKTSRARPRAPWIVSLAMLLAFQAVAQPPEPVSPGDAEPGALVQSRCPTFSWSGVVGGQGHEIALYRVEETAAGEADSVEPELFQRIQIPTGATSWSPSLGRCLEWGGSYAWAVRALDGDGAGAWSEASLFQVAGAPSAVEVEAAIATLKRYLSERAPPRERASETAAPEGLRELLEEEERSPAGARPAARIRQALVSETAGLGAGVATKDAPSLGTPSLTLDSNLALGPNSNIFKDGRLFLWDDASNLALGESALAAAAGTATFNTAVGVNALSNNTEGSVAMEGSYNTALGDNALRYNQVGFDNTALGAGALVFNEGYFNTGVGSGALVANTSGDDNTAVGGWAAIENTTGVQNVAIGSVALGNNTVGSGNIAIGFRAGSELGDVVSAGTSMSNNIFIGNPGGADEVGTIRIGDSGDHTRTFVAGITGIPVNGLSVLVNSNGQLGTTSSSRRFKSGIEMLENVGTGLLELRPVTFRYRPTVADVEGGTQVGLVAEEVVEVFPELVIRDDTGKPFGVRYDLLSVLLLEELQRQHEGLTVLRERITALETAMSNSEPRPLVAGARGGSGPPPRSPTLTGALPEAAAAESEPDLEERWGIGFASPGLDLPRFCGPPAKPGEWAERSPP